MRKLKIRATLNGFVVHVGCQELVFESKARLLSELGRYLDNPEEVEKEYLSKALYRPLEPQPMIFHYGNLNPAGGQLTNEHQRQTT